MFHLKMLRTVVVLCALCACLSDKHVVHRALPAGISPSSDRLQVASTFDDGDFQELEDGGTEPGDVFDGVALIDPEGKKKYFVARDETNRCVCSNELSAAFIREEAPVELTATLAAPPPGVAQVDLVVPRFGTLHDVPLAE